jgi:hypothetical protein
MSALFKNNATALLAASISSSGTTLVLAAGTGIKFPVLVSPDFFYGTIYDSAGNYEIVKVTARTADSLTIVRAQEGTIALAFSSGDAFAQRVTAATLNDFAQKSVNQTFTGNNTFSGTNTHSGTDNFTGTFTAANPTLTGTVTIPTPTVGDNTTKAASTAFVTTAVTNATGALGTISTQNSNAVNITGGSISGITDLAVADGGTGASSFASNAVLLGNGSSSFQTVAPGASGNILASNGSTWQSKTLASSGVKLGLGITGETWNDVTGSRSQGVTYYNTNAYPIQVQGNFGCNGGGQGYIYINGTLISFWQAQFNGCGGYSVNMPCIVPPGASYMLANMGGGARGWYELY